MFTGSPGKSPKTGILNSIVFHKIPTVEFDFVAISIMVRDETFLRCLWWDGAKGPVTACDEVAGDRIFTLYFNTPFISCFTKYKLPINTVKTDRLRI